MHEHDDWREAVICPTCDERRRQGRCTRCGQVPEPVPEIVAVGGGLFNGAWCWPCDDTRRKGTA